MVCLNPELRSVREKEEAEKVERIKQAVEKKETPDVLSKKSKDLFNELFGED